MVKTTESTRHRCECGTWTYGAAGDSTGCLETVTGGRRFAQGHDARLKSLFITAGVARVTSNDGQSLDPAAAASHYGFGQMVASGILRGREVRAKREQRLEEAARARVAKAEACQAKTTAAVISDDAPRQVKVGHWFYDVVGELDGSVTYLDKQGQTRTAPAGAHVRKVEAVASVAEVTR